MGPEEQVALYDAAGRPSGTAPRSQVRARNLTHAATSVVVRDRLGRVHVHRRTDTKDVYPGRHDFAAGGVVAAGEAPYDTAVRELEEELGVAGVALEPLGVRHYGDERTDYWGHLFTTTWDGPVRLQPEEVVWGEWWPVEWLVAALDSDPDVWMPDTAALLGDWLRGRAAHRVEGATQGWDSHAEIVEERWLDRLPRRDDVTHRLWVEVRLMPRLAGRLPLSVPVPESLGTDPVRFRHMLVPGVPVEPDRLTADDGRRVGDFLRRLHDSPASTWSGTGISDDGEQVATLDAMEHQIVPMLPADLQQRGLELLGRARDASRFRVLRHGDLGPDHLLTTDDAVTGVIDWTDVALGDPARDLAWSVHRTPPVFSGALVAAYGATRDELSRGLDWNLLGPWWEVHHGLTGGGEGFVDSGLEGVVARLRAGR